MKETQDNTGGNTGEIKGQGICEGDRQSGLTEQRRRKRT